MVLLEPQVGGRAQAVALAGAVLDGYQSTYRAAWSGGMRAKLGLPSGAPETAVTPLIEDLLTLLRADQVDHTGCFRDLAQLARGSAEPARSRFGDLAAFDAWSQRWQALGPDPAAMDRINPVYIPRNHLVEQALSAATGGDLDPATRLLDAVTGPYEARPGLAAYALPAADGNAGYQTFCGT